MRKVTKEQNLSEMPVKKTLKRARRRPSSQGRRSSQISKRKNIRHNHHAIADVRDVFAAKVSSSLAVKIDSDLITSQTVRFFHNIIVAHYSDSTNGSASFLRNRDTYLRNLRKMKEIIENCEETLNVELVYWQEHLLTGEIVSEGFDCDYDEALAELKDLLKEVGLETLSLDRTNAVDTGRLLLAIFSDRYDGCQEKINSLGRKLQFLISSLSYNS